MSPIQRKLYKTFMDLIENGQNQWIGTNPLKAFAVCCKVCIACDVILTTCHTFYINTYDIPNRYGTIPMYYIWLMASTRKPH